MKKLLAILLSALLLCAMIPFATVAAAESDAVVQLSIVDELAEVNAGDEFQVQVDLLGLENTAGLIGARVEIGFDTDVFEAVTCFDEDEEMWLPAIEVGSKYNASSNKYIMYGQIYEDTGAMKNCLVKYMRATASASQVRKEEHFFTVTLKVKDNAPSGTYDLTVVDNEGVDLLAHGNQEVTWTAVTTSITVNGADAECKHVYNYVCDAYCANCGELTNPDAAHSVIHVEAKDPVNCIENGNKEYWYCEHCNSVWLDADCLNQTNLMSVRVVGDCVSNAAPCQDGECVNCGLPVEAVAEHSYFYACDSVCQVCYEITNPDAAHNVAHVEAVDPTATENGNVEYWYCTECGTAWLDANQQQQTNLKNVIIPATGEITYGDANGDGKLNNRDLALMQQYLNGYDMSGKTFDEKAADMDGNGKINNRDLGLLQKELNK